MFHFFIRIIFVCGFLIGIFLALALSFLHHKKTKSSLQNYALQNSSLLDLYEIWFKKVIVKRKSISMDSLRYGVDQYLTESEYLFKNVKVLCVILVRNLKNSQSANRTWTSQCNDVVFINLESKKKRIPIRQNKNNASWPLLCKALHSFSNVFNWILIVNDNTFAILENVRHLVAALNSTKCYYLGHAMTFWGASYNSGQAGYLLSNGTLAALKNKLFNDSLCTLDSTFWNMEDYYLGKTLATLQIYPSDTRDSFSLSTFHGFNLQKMFFPGSTLLSNYYKFNLYPTQCCSSHSVTFQIEDGDKMFTFYYLLYQLQIFREGALGNVVPTTPLPEQNVWKSFLKQQGIRDTNVSAQQYYDIWKDYVGDQTPLFPH